MLQQRDVVQAERDRSAWSQLTIGASDVSYDALEHTLIYPFYRYVQLSPHHCWEEGWSYHTVWKSYMRAKNGSAYWSETSPVVPCKVTGWFLGVLKNSGGTDCFQDSSLNPRILSLHNARVHRAVQEHRVARYLDTLESTLRQIPRRWRGLDQRIRNNCRGDKHICTHHYTGALSTALWHCWCYVGQLLV